ncbi:TcpE family conjugal transfer membrane protein [Lentibacillus sp. N15]
MNGFLKFERKLYQVFGLPLGRPIRFKSILYFIVIAVIEIVIYFTPFIGKLVSWLPFGILALIPIGLAWLLADIGTEDRVPLSFFRSFVQYQIRKIKGHTYFRSREVQKEKSYSFNNYFTHQDVIEPTSEFLITRTRDADEEKEKALRYIDRITNSDEFFERLQEKRELEAQRKNKRKWFFFKKGA